jgi:hypothetical protein
MHTFVAAPLAVLATTGAAVAHPGHDAAITHGAAHWLTEWSHWIVVALALLTVVEIARRAIRFLIVRRARQEDTAL